MMKLIPKNKPVSAVIFLLLFGLFLMVRLWAAEPVLAIAHSVSAQVDPGGFATALKASEIDDAASEDWVDGIARRLANPNALRQTIWTESAPTGGPLRYGASAKPGVRHLRLGFTQFIGVGSILMRGGGEVSVLRTNAAYPGNLADESEWIPATRLVDGSSGQVSSGQTSSAQVSSAEVSQAGYGLWVLPAGTKCRAIRFTHTALPTDSNFTGILGGVYLLSGRFANIASQAIVSASANRTAAPLLTDDQYNGWAAWDNGPQYAQAVSPTAPEWVILTWSRPVTVAGLAMLWAGFNSGDAEIFTGPATLTPQDAPEANWQLAGHPFSLRNQYPRALGIDWADFGKPITTRAIRLRMTAVTDESHHPHLAGKTRNGTRVWLGELMALEPLESNDLQTAVLPALTHTLPKPPIPVHFTLEASGYVTLVIDNAKGDRVRNLISDTWFDKGANTVWWDGTDDLSRNPDAANHGVYLIPTHFVPAGTYHVRGLTHGAIDLHYEFSVYNSGNPGWETVDTKGGWLTNHTPPSSALFVPGNQAPGGKPLMYLGSYVSEGGAGLAWVDLNGQKQGGRGWIGGSWTAAPFLARDLGPHADPDTYAYVGAPTGDGSGQAGKPIKAIIRLTGLTKHGDKSILNFSFDPGPKIERGDGGKVDWTHGMGGLAVYNSLAVISLPLQNQLLLIDTQAGKSLGMVPVEKPHGLAFTADGQLLILSGKQLLRFSVPGKAGLNPRELSKPEVLVTEGLEDPSAITTDSNGNIYISDDGDANQVLVFTSAGKPVRTIGHRGPSQAGPYDALHMNHPAGLAIDSMNHLWVTEADFQPKRVSVWSLDGQFIQAFYGPAEYGGGGSLDPQDKNKFYYHGMEFKLDWKTGANAITTILYRPDKDKIPLPNSGFPSTVLYSGGHRYFINSYLGQATNGVTVGVLFLDTGGVLHPVSALGKANDWPLLKQDAYQPYLPPGSDLSSNSPDKSLLFTWSDLNENGKVDPEELHFLKSTTGSIVIASPSTTSDGSTPTASTNGPLMLDANLGGKAVRFVPAGISPSGVPVYDLSKIEIIADGAQATASDGGGQILESREHAILTTAPLPYAREGIGGIDVNHRSWSYPSLWPGLHPSHSAPLADHPGELIGTTHLLGPLVYPEKVYPEKIYPERIHPQGAHPVGSDVDPLWAINGNAGDVYLFTADGLFVTQLFQDARAGKPWNMPQAPRDMLLNDVTLHDENFFPSMTQTADGNVYIVDGSRTSVVRVDGLDTLRKIPDATFEITSGDLSKSAAFLNQQEASRQSLSGTQKLQVMVRPGTAPPLKDLVNEEKAAEWAIVDRRITQQGWNQKPDLVEAAICVYGDNLLAAFRTNDPKLLINSGTIANAPFKTGGALDLMIGTNPAANPNRDSPAIGDLRLLVYQVNGRTKATLYRAVVPGTTSPVPFSSPARTITLDQVQDVSDRVELSADNGNYAFSIPLSALGLKPTKGGQIKADIGILRGNQTQTTQRSYWSNKATGIVSDVPSEAELKPNLWGDWIFQIAP